MKDTPVFANLSTSSIFVAKGIDFFSFCRPSLGPTSTILTLLSVRCCCCAAAAGFLMSDAVAKRRRK